MRKAALAGLVVEIAAMTTAASSSSGSSGAAGRPTRRGSGEGGQVGPSFVQNAVEIRQCSPCSRSTCLEELT